MKYAATLQYSWSGTREGDTVIVRAIRPLFATLQAPYGLDRPQTNKFKLGIPDHDEVRDVGPRKVHRQAVFVIRDLEMRCRT